MGEPLGDATWKEDAVGAPRGVGAPKVRPHLGVAVLPSPSTWQFVVGLGALPCRCLAQIGMVSGPLSLFTYFVLSWLHILTLFPCISCMWHAEQWFSNTCGTRSIQVTYVCNHASLSFVLCLNWQSNVVDKDCQQTPSNVPSHAKSMVVESVSAIQCSINITWSFGCKQQPTK